VNMTLPRTIGTNWYSRLKAAGIHLALSLLVAALAASLVLGVWYPSPFREISGGRELFVLLVSVDIVLGPLMTFFIFNRSKAAKELRRDLAVVVALQAGALIYGLHTVWVARPIYLVFEVDRFSVVRAIDIDPRDLVRAPLDMRTIPLWGPRLIAAEPPTDPEERMRSLDMALGGVDINFRPETWRTYESNRQRVLLAAKPLSEHELEVAVKLSGLPAESIAYLPIVARELGWVALVSRKDARVVGYLPFGGY
jgi:hypothetical protein